MSKAKAFYELSKPGIVYGNLITAVAGYLLACKLRVDWVSFIGMAVGLSLVIAGACAVNNLYDRDIDTKMDRTKKRPSVTGEVSLKAGKVFAVLTTVIGIVVLGFSTNILTMLIALLGFVVYTTAYTFSKRITHHSTLIGSISGATPIVGGYVAYSGHIDAVAIIIGLMMLVWQMPHFYAIAIYREKDYKEAGIPSLPSVAGKKITSYWMMFYTLLFALLSVLLYRYAPVGIIYLTVMGLTSLLWLGLNFSGLFTKGLDVWAKRSFLSSLMVMVIMSLALAFR